MTVSYEIINPKYLGLILKLRSLHRDHLNSGRTFQECLDNYENRTEQFAENWKSLELPEFISDTLCTDEVMEINGDYIFSDGTSYNNSIHIFKLEIFELECNN